MIRLLSIRFIVVCATLLCSVAALAYPLKPVRMIVPYPPGGGTDIMARAVSAKLSEIWGMQVVVDNRGGGGTIIGTEIAARSPADGYTLLITSTSFVINPTTRARLPYDTILPITPHVRSGRLRALGVSSEKRSSILPDLPTIAEAGVPGYHTISWTGMFVPTGVPHAIIEKLNADVVKIIHQTDTRARLASDGAEPAGTSAKEFDAFIRSEIVKWAKVIRVAKISIN